MDVAAFFFSVLACLQTGDDGLRSALVQPPANSQAASPLSAAANNSVNQSAVEPRAFDSSNQANQLQSQSASPALTHAATAMIERLLVSREATTTRGNQVRLAEAIAAADPDRRAQVIQGYWKLSQALARNRALERYRARLNDIQNSAATDLERNLAKAAYRQANARLQDANAEFAAAAHELIANSGGKLANGIAPASLPHAGGYDTRFDEIFANSTATTEMRLLNERIPAWRAIVDARAECVIAGEDAYLAFVEARSAGLSQTADCLTAAARLLEQELAFMNSVYVYNTDIATYALAVGGEQEPQVLASMLIKDRVIPTNAAALAERVIPVSGSDGFRAADASTEANVGQPTLATSPDGTPRTFHPPVEVAPLTNDTVSGATSPLPNHGNTSQMQSGGANGSAQQQQGWEPVPGYKRDGEAQGNGTNEPPNNNGAIRPLTDRYQSNYRGQMQAGGTSSLTAKLADFSPQVVTGAAAITLCDAWNQAPTNAKALAATAYWRTCQAAAECQLREATQQSLLRYQRELLESPQHPHRVTDMLSLRAARSEALATGLEAKVRLKDACFELARVVRHTSPNSLICMAATPGSDFTLYERQLLNAAQASEPTEFSRTSQQLDGWESARQSAMSALQSAEEDFRGGGSLRPTLHAIAQNDEITLRGLSALVAFRKTVSENVARQVAPGEQCTALTAR